MLISELENWANPIFVGEPSASRGNHFGDSRRLVLPNSHVTVRVSTLYWQLSDPRDDRPWIEPEVAASLTSADYRAGRDPALAAIAHYVPAPSLADRLQALLIAGDGAAAATALRAFLDDPVHAWIDPARALAPLPNALRAAGRPDAAAAAERIVASLPPWAPPRY